MSQTHVKNIFFFFGIVAVVIMLFTFDVSFAELWDYIRQAGYWLLAILVLWGVLYMLNAWAWRVIIRGSGPCPVGYGYLLKLTVSGFALNYTTPIGLLGGEPYKIMEMTKHIGVQRATSSVVLFAMMHVFAHFCFWTTSIVVYLLLAAMGLLSLNIGMGIVLALATAFCGGGIYLFIKGYKNGMVVKLLHFIGKIPGLKNWSSRFEREHHEDLVKIDRQIAELHSQERRTFYKSLLIEYVGRISQSLEIMFMLILFGIDGKLCMMYNVQFTMYNPQSSIFNLQFLIYSLLFLYSFLILSFTSLFANILGFLPLQLGGREGGFALSVTQLGMTGGVGLFISIICRVRELFWAVVGLALMRVK
ncbi:MAG: flippase-like domain-containing protein [Bacteroidaceae bacterium]|nr:flippase-like domain-containing protein [Bacteroidaceae bacterium]